MVHVKRKKKESEKHKAEKWRDVVRVCGWVDCEASGSLEFCH